MIVVVVCLLAGCSRKAAVDSAEDAATTSTVPVSETTATTSTLPADSSVPADDPNASTSTTDTEDNTDAFGHTDADNAAFRAAYSQAFEAECQRIWGMAGADGLMADPDFPEDTYAVSDCTDELDPSNGEFTDSVGEAQSTGVDDAQIAASDLADPLCATGGTPCFSYGD